LLRDCLLRRNVRGDRCPGLVQMFNHRRMQSNACHSFRSILTPSDLLHYRHVKITSLWIFQVNPRITEMEQTAFCGKPKKI